MQRCEDAILKKILLDFGSVYYETLLDFFLEPLNENNSDPLE